MRVRGVRHRPSPDRRRHRGHDALRPGPAHARGMPQSPNHPAFRLTLQRRHGDMVRADGGSAANELIVTGGARRHPRRRARATSRQDGLLYGGVDAAEACSAADGFTEHGVETFAPCVGRGVLLDVAGRARGRALPAGLRDHRRRPASGRRRPASSSARATPSLVRTGWARRWDEPRPSSATTPASPVPGEEARRGWPPGVRSSSAATPSRSSSIAARGRSRPAAGAPGPPRRARHPHHRDDATWRSCRRRGARVPLRARPLPLVGATGSPVRPLAVVRSVTPDRRPWPAARRLRRRDAVTTPARRRPRRRRRTASSTSSGSPCAARGRRNGAAAAVAARRRRWGGTPGATAIGSGGRRCPAPSAALVNGMLAHALDYDDTHLPSVLHPSASSSRPRSPRPRPPAPTGGALIAAVAAGSRSPSGSAWPATTRRPGNSSSSSAASTPPRSAAPSAPRRPPRALGLRRRRHRRTRWASPRSMGAGHHRGQPHRRHGQAAALRLGRPRRRHRPPSSPPTGFTGPPTVLEGRFGFFAAPTAAAVRRRGASLDGLGERWELLRTVLQALPANHFTHAGIDAALALRAARPRPPTMWTVELGVAAPSLRTIGEPLEEKRRREPATTASSAGPYTVAAALLGGGGLGLGLDDFTDELARDPAPLALMAKVDVVPDERCDRDLPAPVPGRADRAPRRGRESVEGVSSPTRGGPRRPLGFDELAAKFRAQRRALGARAGRPRRRRRRAGTARRPSRHRSHGPDGALLR